MNARIIVNSRYFSIAQSGQKADGKFVLPKNAAAALVNYVATRETVSLNIAPAEYQYRLATMKQKETIKEIVKIMPKLKNTFEYEDYINNATISNASEFISKFAELNIGGVLSEDTAQNLVEYVAKRPGVFKVGEHGLFGAEDSVDLGSIQDEISNHRGKIWTHVVSLHREDADKLGYNSQKLWKDAIKSQLPNIAKQHGIKPENLRWYAGMHNTGHHPHIHLFVYSSDPKEGYIDAEGISKIKSGFSKVIFENEQIYSQEFYENKDAKRQAVKEKASEILKNLPTNAAETFTYEQYAIIKDNLLKLSDYLRTYSGRPVYAYISKEAKILVDNIVDELSECEDIKELYDLWCDDKLQQKLHYAKEKISLPKLSEAEDFKSIKNNIIAYASKLSNDSFTENSVLGHMPQSENGFNIDKIEENDEKNFEEEQSLKENITTSADDFSHLNDYDNTNSIQENSNLDENLPLDVEALKNDPVISYYFSMDYLELAEAANHGDGKAAYKLGMMYLYGSKDKKSPIEKDYEKAMQWFTVGSNSGENLCEYELGRMYLYGKGIEHDPTVRKWGYELINRAYNGFRQQISDAGQNIIELVEDGTAYKVGNHAGYLEYLCGRINYFGELAESSEDYIKAFAYFSAADFNDCNKAKYNLANMYYYGKGINCDYEKAFDLYKECAGEDGQQHIYAAAKAAQMYQNGIGTKIDEKKALELYEAAAKEGVASALYALGEKYKQDRVDVSYKYFSRALEQMIKDDEVNKISRNEILIGDMYAQGKGTEIDKTEAVKWYKLAAENGNADDCYRIAEIFDHSDIAEHDTEFADKCYSKALSGFIEAQKDNKSYVYELKIADMYYNGKGTKADKSEAAEWYERAMPKSGFAAFRLAQMYEQGDGVEQDAEISEYCYKIAIRHFEEKELKGEDVYTESRLADMYYNGKGTEVNKSEAAKWYKAAADNVNSSAMYRYAVMSELGEGIEVNPTAAQQYYRKALRAFEEEYEVTQSPQLACKIAEFYELGNGTEQNIEKALEFYEKAAENGLEYAQKHIDAIQDYQQEATANAAYDLFRLLATALRNNTGQSVYNVSYKADSRIRRREKIEKMLAGQQADDYYDLDYYSKQQREQSG